MPAQSSTEQTKPKFIKKKEQTKPKNIVWSFGVLWFFSKLIDTANKNLIFEQTTNKIHTPRGPRFGGFELGPGLPVTNHASGRGSHACPSARQSSESARRCLGWRSTITHSMFVAAGQAAGERFCHRIARHTRHSAASGVSWRYGLLLMDF